MLNHRKSFAVAVLLAIGLALPAFVQAQNYPPSVGQMVAATKKQVKTITMADFKAAVDRKAVGVLVDVREPEEFADGHVAGAVNVPRGLVEFKIWTHVGFPDKTDMGKQLTLYCATGGRCALAAKSLQDLGFTNVASVDMKLEDWVKAGYPLVK
ncbi:MAG: rhodanese-like domain-containing protein [Betaproteobacteria bacterium]